MLNVYVPPPATGRRHDTMHHRTTRPAAHAPLSTCQGPDPGTTPPLLTSGADTTPSTRRCCRAPLSALPVASDAPRGAQSAPREALAAHNRMIPHPAAVVKVFESSRLTLHHRDLAVSTVAVCHSPRYGGDGKYTQYTDRCQGYGHLSRKPRPPAGRPTSPLQYHRPAPAAAGGWHHACDTRTARGRYHRRPGAGTPRRGTARPSRAVTV